MGQSKMYVVLNSGSASVETNEQVSRLEINSDEPSTALLPSNVTDTYYY